MRRVILSSVACPVLHYFSTYLIKATVFEKKNIGHNVCVFSLQLLPETFLILRITQRDIITHVHWSKCTVPVILDRLKHFKA